MGSEPKEVTRKPRELRRGKQPQGARVMSWRAPHKVCSKGTTEGGGSRGSNWRGMRTVSLVVDHRFVRNCLRKILTGLRMGEGLGARRSILETHSLPHDWLRTTPSYSHHWAALTTWRAGGPEPWPPLSPKWIFD